MGKVQHEPKEHFLAASGWGKDFLLLLGDARRGDTIVVNSEKQRDLCKKLKQQSPYARKNLDIVYRPDSSQQPSL